MCVELSWGPGVVRVLKWWLSLQHPDWASRVWGVGKTGGWEQVGVCVVGGSAGEVGASQKSWEKALPFTLRDLLPPEPLSVPASGLPLLPPNTPPVERVSGPTHSSCKAPRDRETAPGARDSVVLASILEPQFVALSNLPNSGG